MEFGKLPSVDQVDFALPAVSQRCKEKLSLSDSSELRVYLGATGWGMKEWVGEYYPKGTKTKDFLSAYSKQFNTIELNTTHYRIPDYATIERWRETSAPDFKFCPKLTQTISHRNDLGMASGQLDAFINSIEGLGAKLGPCFMQLPPYFDGSKLPILRSFLRAWPAEMRLAIEFRHTDWFSEAMNEELYKLMQNGPFTKLITDVAGRRDVLHIDIWQPYLLLRFVGNDFHPSDYTRMEAWIDKMLQLKSLGLKEFYFFAHQPDNARAPEAIEFLLKSLKTNSGVFTKPMLPKFNNQLPLF